VRDGHHGDDEADEVGKDDSRQPCPGSTEGQEKKRILYVLLPNGTYGHVVLRGGHPSEVSTAQLKHSCNEKFCSIDCSMNRGSEF
jgi:hypothetical protein